MKLRTIPLSKINRAPYNPRVALKPGDHEYEHLHKSIEEFGLVDPLVWNEKSGVLVGGHQRLTVLENLGQTKVQVSVVYLDEAREKALNIALNKISGQWDMPLLKDLLVEIDTGEFDMDVTGFSEAELEDLMTQFYMPEIEEDEPPDPPAKPITKPGDVWRLGDHRLICGDATRAETYERLLGNETPALVLTDPPYGVAIGDKNKSLNAVGRSNRIEENLAGDEGILQVEALWAAAFPRMCEAMPAGCPFYVFGPQGGDFGLLLLLLLRDGDLPARHILIWAKDQQTFSIGRLDYEYQHEPIAYGWKKGAAHAWYASGPQSSLIDFPRPRVSKLHPTMKPVGLIAKLMENSTRKNAIVMDPFLGSGTTIMAAEQLGRRCYGMEIDPAYCDVTVQRWEQFTGKKAERVKA